jgi:hypothetical protein
MLAGTLALAAFGAPSASAAQTFHVSPTGSGAECTAASPCNIANGIGFANSGDTILAAGDDGTYGTATTPTAEIFEIPGGVTFAGEPEQPPPTFYSEASGFGFRLQSGANLVGVRIHYLKGSGWAIYANGPNRIERVFSEAPNEFATACGGADPGTTIVDSVCTGAYGMFDVVGGGGSWPVNLVNDTIVAEHTAVILGSSGPALTLEAVNTIIEGEPKDITATDSGGTVAVTLINSNYDQVEASGGATITAPGTAGNQTAPAELVDPGAGDFAELPGSPTVDAGVATAANGSLDLEGNPRSLSAEPFCDGPHPGTPDIGALELVPAPPAAASCEPAAAGPGGGGTPPGGPSAGEQNKRKQGASADITFGKLTRHPKNGTATLIADVSGAGRLTVTGKGLVKRTAPAAAAGSVKLYLKAKGKAAERLGEEGSAKFEVKVAFAPTGATAVAATRRVKLLEHPAVPR